MKQVFTHILVTLLTLLKVWVYESKRLLWRNLNPYTTCMRNIKSNCVNWMGKTFICSSFNKYIICHSEHKQMSIWIWKEWLELSQNNEKVSKKFSISTLSILVECDARLYLIGFPTLLGKIQQTLIEEKPYECWTVYLLLFAPVYFLIQYVV